MCATLWFSLKFCLKPLRSESHFSPRGSRPAPRFSLFSSLLFSQFTTFFLHLFRSGVLTQNLPGIDLQKKSPYFMLRWHGRAQAVFYLSIYRLHSIVQARGLAYPHARACANKQGNRAAGDSSAHSCRARMRRVLRALARVVLDGGHGALGRGA